MNILLVVIGLNDDKQVAVKLTCSSIPGMLRGLLSEHTRATPSSAAFLCGFASQMNVWSVVVKLAR